MPPRQTPVPLTEEEERRRCYDLANRCLDAALASPPSPGGTEGDLCGMLAALMRTIRRGGSVAYLEAACPNVFR